MREYLHETEWFQYECGDTRNAIFTASHGIIYHHPGRPIRRQTIVACSLALEQKNPGPFHLVSRPVEYTRTNLPFFTSVSYFITLLLWNADTEKSGAGNAAIPPNTAASSSAPDNPHHKGPRHEYLTDARYP